MPLKKIILTGKRPGVAPQIDADTAQSLIYDGRGWSNKDRTSAYDKLNPDQLLEALASWSPTVRERAAQALARRKEKPAVDVLVKMLESPSINARYGACELLASLRGHAAPAIPTLIKQMDHKDLWLRIKAAEALASIGPEAMSTAPLLLQRLAQQPGADDPRGMEQRYLCFNVFGKMLKNSLAGVDETLLRNAVVAGLQNQDGRARSDIASLYSKLSFEQIKPLLPAIHRAVVEPAPSGEMFADGIRVEGLRILAKYHVKEGIPACVNYTRSQNAWASQIRTPELMKILLSYGTHAKAVIPQLTEIGNYFEKDEKDFPRQLMIQKAACVRETIQAIEAATETPELISIQ